MEIRTTHIYEMDSKNVKQYRRKIELVEKVFRVIDFLVKC